MRHRNQRGATVFVVMLVITLLTGLGLFAVRSASLANVSSGFNRHLTQTHYVTDYAVTTMVSELARNATTHAINMKSGQETGCVAYAAQITPTCAIYGYTDLQNLAQTSNPSAILLDPPLFGGSVHGSLGHAPVEGDMRIELTDFHPAWPPLAGHDVSSSIGYAMVTVSATGMVRPQQLTPGVWDTASATAAGVELARAHVLIGPVELR